MHMAKHSRVWNQSVHENYLREGRGRGDGPGYTPWIRIQDFASKGVVSRVKGRKTERIHHLMSNNELAYFYLLDWSSNVLDIREQYPLLDLACAINIAAQAGIRYPTDKTSGYPYVLTCDFMITTTEGFKARTIKSSSELNNIRVLEKLEIERRYWLSKGIDWKVVTEKQISYCKAKNIEWLYSAQKVDWPQDERKTIEVAKTAIMENYERGDTSIAAVIKAIEDEFSLERGCGLLLFKSLALEGTISVNLDSPINLGAQKVLVTA
jgi:hypothetical protein